MKNLSSKSYILIAFLNCFIFLNTGCIDDNLKQCATTQEGQNYTLEDNTLDYFENYNDANQIIFKNSTLDDITFTLSEVTNIVGEYGYNRICDVDNSLFQYVTGQAQFVNVYLNNSEFEKPIYLQLGEYPEIDDSPGYEAIEIFHGPLTELDQGDGLFQYRTNAENPLATIHDSLELNGRLYYDVIDIEDPDAMPNFKIQITKQEGIIHIIDNENGEEYFYDRKE